ncbi:hypothetical protein HPT27_12525 [Permianibacter sp. IMCC34836]|uniref:GIN domain-containing protein n=1 Tax=Permianibacter fluminis TaxID=2738515 RepID=UPI0015577842|nr:DUF2807 domain-containing protein [Permianibacter fluminis]NQD37853.1 hypothetical protein [Permianibacter fluminis]
MLKQRIWRGLIAVLMLAMGPVSAAEGDVVPGFTKVTISVAGNTQIHAGGEYRVSIKAEVSMRQRIKVDVDGDTLRVYCPGNCGSLHHDGIDVYLPQLNELHLLNGGRIELDTGLPVANSLGLTVHNGGTIDAGNAIAERVVAEVHNGGRIVLAACSQLDTRIRNGGDIQYFGTPKISKDVINGGNVSSASGGESIVACNKAEANAAQ